MLLLSMYHSVFQSVGYCLKTLYLFTENDLICIALTNTICGLTLPLSNEILIRPAFLKDVIFRAPIVFFWIWINLLFFNISNQSQLGAVLEDSINKPWRPLPSGRIKQQHVRRYIAGARLAILATSLILGGSFPSFMIQILTFCYNNLGGGEMWLSRNLLNAGGYLSFLIGAMQIALGVHNLECSVDGCSWLCCIAAIICCTMHVQDLYDQEGDRLRDRRTIPLVFGDRTARYTIAIPVLISSLLAPVSWQLSYAGFLPFTALGLLVITRLMAIPHHTPRSDKLTPVLERVDNLLYPPTIIRNFDREIPQYSDA